MIALALLASHLVGDFVLQTRWQANGKLDDWRVRLRHVVAYLAPFYVLIHLPLFLPLPIRDATEWRAWAFFGGIGVLHFLTDSRRFHSTLGEWLVWQTFSDDERRDFYGGEYRSDGIVPGIPANPWPALPLMVDQTLHVVQLAALGWLLV